MSDSEKIVIMNYGRIERQQEVIISLVEYLKTTSLQQKVKLITKYYYQGIQTNASLTKITDYIKMSSQEQGDYI